MTIVGNLRLDVAREQARRLEDVVRETRLEYADADPRVLGELLAPVIDELTKLRANIDAALGIESVRLGASSVRLRFRGRNVGEGRGPAQMVGKALASLQRGTRQASGFLERGVALGRRIGDDLLLASELDVLGFATGSLVIMLAPRIEQLSLTEAGVLAERGLGLLIQAAEWAQSARSDEFLDRLIPNPQVRRQLVNRVREIAPSQKADFESIEIAGPVVTERLGGIESMLLTVSAYGHAAGYLRRRTKEEVSYSGRLVMVDVEKDIFDLRVTSRRIHCHFKDVDRESSKSLVEQHVEVRGIGFFEQEDEDPYRIDVQEVRQLSLDEIARLES